MERAVKERLIGASLLILAAVVIVPWLLDGTERASSETTELELPGAGAVQNETRTIVLDGTVPGGSGVLRPGTETIEPARGSAQNGEMSAGNDAADRGSRESVPPEAPPAISATATTPVSESATSRSAPPVAEPPPAVFTQPGSAADEPASATVRKPALPATSGTEWAVQVGSFALQENAERLADRLKNKGYSAFVMRNVVDGRVRYRVRVGPMTMRGEADELAAALRADRQPARVVSHP